MARGYGNNDAPRRDASLDPARRIFKDDAARGTVAEAGLRAGFPARRPGRASGSSAVMVTLGGTMPTRDRQPRTCSSINILRIKKPFFFTHRLSPDRIHGNREGGRSAYRMCSPRTWGRRRGLRESTRATRAQRDPPQQPRAPTDTRTPPLATQGAPPPSPRSERP